MTKNKKCVVRAELAANVSGYTYLSKKNNDNVISHILYNGRFSGHNYLDSLTRQSIDYIEIFKKAISDSLTLKSFSLFLEKNNYIVNVNFKNNENSLIITITSLDTVATRMLFVDDKIEESLDLEFYVKVLIDFSDGFIIQSLDAQIVDCNE